MLLPQLFLQRLNAACIWSDCISGVIVTAAIILSFLSLMTFADFLADQLLRCGGVGCDAALPSPLYLPYLSSYDRIVRWYPLGAVAA